MKYLLLCCFLTTFFSCTLDYDGSIRTEFKGEIVDEFGNPLQNVSVKSAAELRSDSTYGGYDYDEIAIGRTNEKGEFKLIFPSPTNETNLLLMLNYGDSENPENSELSQTLYYYIDENELTDHRMDIGRVEIVSVNNMVSLSLTYHNPNQYWILGENIEGRLKNKKINVSPENFNNHFQNYSNQYLVAPNQTLKVYYYYQTENSEVMSGYHEIIVQNQDIQYEISL